MASFDSGSKNATLVFINIPENMSKANIFEVLTEFGPLSSFSVHSENVLGRHHCYAYVDYQKEEDAKIAIGFNSCVGTLNTRVTRYDPDIGKVFISNLDQSLENKDLYAKFSKFGNILSCKVAKNHLGKSVGKAFVRFETEEAAKTCIQNYNELNSNGEPINVEKFNICEENEEKEVDEKRKILMEFKMAVRNSLFNESNSTIEVIQKTDTMKSENKITALEGTQSSVEDENKTKIQKVPKKIKKDSKKNDIFSLYPVFKEENVIKMKISDIKWDSGYFSTSELELNHGF